MKNSEIFDVVIIGGSYAGLSAAMALGRSLRQVLIIDSGNPCNKQTPHSHNVITLDGETPAFIAAKAKEQVLRYETVQFVRDQATHVSKEGAHFLVQTASSGPFTAKKVLFATGLKDILPEIPGFSACWGISVLHCPYCHGYEVHHNKIGVLGNGDSGFEFVKLIHNWTTDLTLFTNGVSTLTVPQVDQLKQHQIQIIEHPIHSLEHENGYLKNIVFTEGSIHALAALFAKVPFTQHCSLPQELGCQLTEAGFIQVDDFQGTSVPGVYAAGDNTTMFRSVSIAIAAGTKAGSLLNKELIDESF